MWQQVSEEDAKKALNEQYGGEDATTPGAGLNTFKFTKYSNAYMLVYVRKSDWDQVASSAQSPPISAVAPCPWVLILAGCLCSEDLAPSFLSGFDEACL